MYQGLVGTIILHNGPGGWGSRSLLFLANAILDLLTLLVPGYGVLTLTHRGVTDRFVYRAAIAARLVRIR